MLVSKLNEMPVSKFNEMLVSKFGWIVTIGEKNIVVLAFGSNSKEGA